MAVNDECKLKFLELKAQRSFRIIIFKIEEKLDQPEESYEDFMHRCRLTSVAMPSSTLILSLMIIAKRARSYSCLGKKQEHPPSASIRILSIGSLFNINTPTSKKSSHAKI
ncbi:hypothetical protein OPV22_005723 [Ensete ventricosum]|uniref:ADF-H domain-containing protein n=1 Tax=Ensete ventricosum TaxID=4639 RepID=A0AAV8Q258_ENSVE|nr:hypothetical protein OPV22_005723 [Ensete ventricosum]